MLAVVPMSLLSSTIKFQHVALLAILIGALFLLHIRRILARARFARLHHCKPIAHTLHKEPFLGLDALAVALHHLLRHDLLDYICGLFATHGHTVRFRELQNDVILTREPENIKTILSLRFSDYGVQHRLAAFKPLLGRGIFDTDGAHWSSSRALVRPSFSREQVADLSSFEALFQDLISVLPKSETAVVDLQPLFFCYTIDSATEFLFGQSAATLRTSRDQHVFARAFYDAQRAILTRGTLGWMRVFYYSRRAAEANRVCREFAGTFVDEAFRAVREKKAHPQQKQHHDDDEKTKHEKYIFAHELAALTDDRERVLDELMNILLAGRDTTASLLSNLFFMLAKHPAIWEKLRQEVSGLDGRAPTYEELRGLEYVQCCLSECK